MLIIPPESARPVARAPIGSFGEFVALAHAAGELVVQPRMGFSNPREMRTGLITVKRAAATTVGTITLDSYTRVGDHRAARDALAKGIDLNGYPIVAHDTSATQAVCRAFRESTSRSRFGTDQRVRRTSSSPSPSLG